MNFNNSAIKLRTKHIDTCSYIEVSETKKINLQARIEFSRNFPCDS